MMKLNIAFLWHLHQPYYIDPEENTFLLPWVRLHGTKNYLFLAELFNKYPDIKQNVNIVPSLLRQIEIYQEGDVHDTCLLTSEKNAYDLSQDEKEFILRNFFNAHAETMIFTFPRYRELFERWRSVGGNPKRALKLFGISELTDLQVLFNLVWINPTHYTDNDQINEIVEKGRFYTEEDKRVVLDFQRGIINRVIDGYRHIAGQGIAELTVSPFYHPILPILIDSNSAKEADKHTDLPPFRIEFPDDALTQIREGRDYFQRVFGISPSGIWPSEGSVSEESLHLMNREGFHYAFTDELILNRSIKNHFYREQDGLPDKPEVLYQPYRFKDTNFHLFFRDHYLSDLIGFVYKKWDPHDAAGHLVGKFHEIRNKLIHRGFNSDEYIVSVIFDGENPWEYYSNYGIDFLNSLFEKLSDSEELEVTTYRDFMEKGSSRDFPALDYLKPGSWIDGTFRIWFGHAEDFSAWRYIYDLKNRINTNEIEVKSLSRAMKYLHIAEGSDWFWWYGDEHFTSNLLEFDRLFRKNIKRAYKELDLEPPASLEREIFSTDRLVTAIEGDDLVMKAKSLISPTIDGIVTSYYEWIGAAKYIQSPVYGSMHRAGHGIIRAVFAGYDSEYYYLRIDFHDESIQVKGKINLKLTINGIPFDFLFVLEEKTLYQEPSKENHQIPFSVSLGNIFEFAIPLTYLLEEKKGSVNFFIQCTSEGIFEERWPETSSFVLEISGYDPEKEEWIV